jgi:hypothetical protein
VARKKERRIRRWERREQRSEEFRLREQQGLSSPGTSEYSSSDDDDEEENDGGRAPPERWEPSPPSPRAAEAAEETTPGAGVGAPAARQPTRKVTRAAETAGGCGDGHTGSGNNVCRAPEEEETRFFHPEVGDRSPIAASFKLVRD